MNRVADFIQFVKHGIWRIPDKELPGYKRIVIKPLRIVMLSIKGFLENKIDIKASALTYYTLWAVVPILALLLGLARGFGFQTMLENLILERFGNQSIVAMGSGASEGPIESNLAEYILDFAYKYLEKTDEGFILGIGILVLIYAVINMMSQIENTFNEVWEIKKGRSWLRKYTDYFGFIILFPMFFILSAGANVFLNDHLDSLLYTVGLEFVAGPMTNFLAILTPYLLSAIIFFLFYIVIPNTRVKVVPAVISGFIVAIVFQQFIHLYINGQVYLSKINAVYGSFAALPLFLLFMQLSWYIILFGAELSFAIQHHKNFLYDADIRAISPRYKKLISLVICDWIVERFKNGESAITAGDIAEQSNIPDRLVNNIVFSLSKAGIISETATKNPKIMGLQPALPPEKISTGYILKKLDEIGTSNFIPINGVDYENFKEDLDKRYL